MLKVSHSDFLNESTYERGSGTHKILTQVLLLLINLPISGKDMKCFSIQSVVYDLRCVNPYRVIQTYVSNTINFAIYLTIYHIHILDSVPSWGFFPSICCC